MIAHITGSPVAAVNPRTVKCESFVAALIWGHAVLSHKNFSPPTLPSFVVEVFEPTSSTKTSLLGRSWYQYQGFQHQYQQFLALPTLLVAFENCA
jgi:hypothetical protein